MGLKPQGGFGFKTGVDLIHANDTPERYAIIGAHSNNVH